MATLLRAALSSRTGATGRNATRLVAATQGSLHNSISSSTGAETRGLPVLVVVAMRRVGSAERVGEREPHRSDARTAQPNALGGWCQALVLQGGKQFPDWITVGKYFDTTQPPQPLRIAARDFMRIPSSHLPFLRRGCAQAWPAIARLVASGRMERVVWPYYRGGRSPMTWEPS